MQGMVEGYMAPRREKNELVIRARGLRREMTLPEGVLWQVLRKRPAGMKFRRQHPIGALYRRFLLPCGPARGRSGRGSRLHGQSSAAG